MAAQSHFGNSKVSDKRRREVDQRSFESIDENTHSTTYINGQGDESTSAEQPLVALLNDGFSGSLTWSDFLTGVDDITGPISKHGTEHVLAQTSDDSTQNGFRKFSQSQSGSSSDLRIFQDAIGDAGPCSHEVKNCMKVAIGILRALHIPSSTCLKTRHEFPSSKASHPRMIDSVLSANREAVQLISDILKCTCSSSSQLQLVLAVILHKIIIWYRATIRSNVSENESDSSSQSSAAQSLSKNTYGSHAERVSHLPMKLGEYTFDAALECKIRGQIIQNELQHLRFLVDKLSNCVQERSRTLRITRPSEALAKAARAVPPSVRELQLHRKRRDLREIFGGSFTSSCGVSWRVRKQRPKSMPKNESSGLANPKSSCSV